MSLRFFEGPAGSGKTTRIFQELSRILVDSPLGDQQRVLGLTKMHGSRRRMNGRLAALPALRRRFRCTTVDSFAWQILRRWRSLARARGCPEVEEEDYDEVCRLAGTLLSSDVVGRWITRAFPIVVIDEFQDSKGGQLEIFRALSAMATCIAAGDGFQDLNETGENEAVTWAREIGDGEELQGCHRTSASGLLEAAHALRSGRGLPKAGRGFTILGAMNANVGASFVSRNLTWWRERNDIAFIAPVRPETSRFVREVIARVEGKPIGNPPFGPHRIPWESSQEEDCKRFLEALDLPDAPSAEVQAADLPVCDGSGPSRALHRWLERQRRVAGRTSLLKAEIRQQARRIHQRRVRIAERETAVCEP